MERRPSRLDFWGATLTRASGHADSWLDWFKTKRGLSQVGLLAGVMGFGVATIAGWLGLSWFWIPSLVGLLALVLFHETTFAMWKELEEKSQDGITITGTAIESHQVAGHARASVRTVLLDETAQEVGVDRDQIPRALKFEAPRQTTYIRHADTPMSIRWWERFRRYSVEVTAFVPGGVLLDSTSAPNRARLSVLLYFEPEKSI
jgi:hypothetical protein